MMIGPVDPASARPAAVGVIGLGVMGRPMALNALAGLPAGSTVHVTARSRERAAGVVAAGARWHATAREVSAAADVVVLMVPDLAQVRDVLEGPDGLLAGLARDAVVVVSSTVSPDGVRRLGAELTGRAHVVDAPVSGGEEGAVAGSLSIMVGGEDDAVRRVLPVLATMGRPVHLGPLGSGQVAKACNQMIVAATVMALGEASVVAERAGLALGPLFDLLLGGYAGSRIMEVKKQRFVEHDHSPSGPARFMIKDLTFAVDEARRSGTATPQTDVLLEVFTRLTEAGLGDQDTAVVQAWLEAQQRSGDA